MLPDETEKLSTNIESETSDNSNEINDKYSEVLVEQDSSILSVDVELAKSPNARTLKYQFILFSLSILFSVSSYSGLLDLQSSINITDGLGNKSLALMSITTIVCCLFFTPIIISAFGAKVTLLISQGCYVVYVVANFYPVPYILLPAGIFYGLAEALLYTPALMYCIHYGRLIAGIESRNTKDKINQYVGYFWGIFQMNEIFGNLISTIVLGIGKNVVENELNEKNKLYTNINTTSLNYSSNSSIYTQTTDNSNKSKSNSFYTSTYKPVLNTTLPAEDFTNGLNLSTVDNYTTNASKLVHDANTTLFEALEVSERDFSMCGANDCYDEDEYETVMDNYVPISKTALYIIMGIYTFMAISALPMMMAIPALPKNIKTGSLMKNENKKSASLCCGKMWTNLKDTMYHLVTPQQLLMTPIAIYHGLSISFVSSEINRAFMSCTVGVELVGLGMLAGGIANVFSAFLYGAVSGQPIVRNMMLIGAILLDLLLYIFCLLWRPVGDTVWMGYVICILFGITDGVWSPYLDGKYAKYFTKNVEIAFTAQNIWTCVGYAMTYGWTTLLCVKDKIYIQIFSLVLCVVCSVGAEQRHLKYRKIDEEKKLSSIEE